MWSLCAYDGVIKAVEEIPSWVKAKTMETRLIEIYVSWDIILNRVCLHMRRTAVESEPEFELFSREDMHL